jgi:hypothetical protein
MGYLVWIASEARFLYLVVPLAILVVVLKLDHDRDSNYS